MNPDCRGTGTHFGKALEKDRDLAFISTAAICVPISSG